MSKAKRAPRKPRGAGSWRNDPELLRFFEEKGLTSTPKSKSDAKRIAELRKHLPRAPLQVGDRVSFEGYTCEGELVVGRGTLCDVDQSGGTRCVLAEDGFHYELGLRSFRRLVPRRRGKK